MPEPDGSLCLRIRDEGLRVFLEVAVVLVRVELDEGAALVGAAEPEAACLVDVAGHIPRKVAGLPAFLMPEDASHLDLLFP